MPCHSKKWGAALNFCHSDSKDFHNLKCSLRCAIWPPSIVLYSKQLCPASIKQHNVVINPLSSGVIHHLWPLCHATFLHRNKVSLNLGEHPSHTSPLLEPVI